MYSIISTPHKWPIWIKVARGNSPFDTYGTYINNASCKKILQKSPTFSTAAVQAVNKTSLTIWYALVQINFTHDDHKKITRYLSDIIKYNIRIQYINKEYRTEKEYVKNRFTSC